MIVNLIGKTTTQEGLHVEAALDTNTYLKGIKISDKALATVRLVRNEFHGDWNYQILPHAS